MTIEGIDIAHHQNDRDTIAWRRVAETKRFAVIKATEGTGYLDPWHARNIAGARAAGMLVGHYHFAVGLGAAAEADHFIANVKPHYRPGDILVLDFEAPPAGYKTSVMKVADPVGWSLTWLQRVEKALGAMPLMYMSRSVTGQFNWARVVKAGAGLWCAAYAKQMGTPSHWPVTAMWQYTSTGKVPGITGNVDLDTFYGDEAAWRAYGGAAAGKDTPVTTPNEPTKKQMRAAVTVAIKTIRKALRTLEKAVAKK